MFLPSDKQKTVTFGLDIWERYVKVYESKSEQYWRDRYNIRSVTGLMVMDLRKSILEREESQ